MKAKRATWAEKVPGLDPAKVVFIDETSANTKMTRRYGRAPVGERVVGAVPHGHWKTTTFVAALRADGLVAPMVIDGAMNGDLFVAYEHFCGGVEREPLSRDTFGRRLEDAGHPPKKGAKGVRIREGLRLL